MVGGIGWSDLDCLPFRFPENMLVHLQSEHRSFRADLVQVSRLLGPHKRLAVEKAFQGQNDEIAFIGLVAGRWCLESSVLLAQDIHAFRQLFVGYGARI